MTFFCISLVPSWILVTRAPRRWVSAHLVMRPLAPIRGSVSSGASPTMPNEHYDGTVPGRWLVYGLFGALLAGAAYKDAASSATQFHAAAVGLLAVGIALFAVGTAGESDRRGWVRSTLLLGVLILLMGVVVGQRFENLPWTVASTSRGSGTAVAGWSWGSPRRSGELRSSWRASRRASCPSRPPFGSSCGGERSSPSNGRRRHSAAGSWRRARSSSRT